MLLLYIVGIIFFSLLLIKSADLVVIILRKISRETHIKSFVISAIILALGTSLPELFVGVTSAFEKSSNLSLGVIIGSNIANIALIGGLAALIAGKVAVVHQGDVQRDIAISLIAGLIPLILAVDGDVSKVDGLILIVMYLSYATGFFRKRYEEIGVEHQEGSFVAKLFRRFEYVNSVKRADFGKLFLGVAMLLATADIIVKLSVKLALIANLPLFLVGVFVIAVGTSLPEFAFSIQSLRNHEPSMFLGNLLGSTIANSTLIIGISSFIYPIKIVAFSSYVKAGIFFVLVFLLFFLFIKTKRRFERWEAIVLLFVYLIFFLVEFFMR